MDRPIDQQLCRECLAWHDDILDTLATLKNEQITRSHLFDGRFENLYVEAGELPELYPLLDYIKSVAAKQLQCDTTSLSMGFWFNIMQPGEKTSLHSHDDFDELLSGVYYLQVPADSGDLIIHLDNKQKQITPQPGLLLFFSPALAHEVTENHSDRARISLAFNLGRVAQA